MKKILLPLLIMFGISSLASARNSEEEIIKPSKQNAEVVVKLRKTIATIDDELSGDSARIRLFAQLADKEKTDKEGYLVPSKKVVSVTNSDSWPELTVTSYIVLFRADGTVEALQEVPVSESGDWENIYTHYFDRKGNTVAFKRYLSFFVGCKDSSSEELSTYYYQGHELIAKDYSLKGGDNKILQPSQCEFMYRHDYSIQRTWEDSKKSSGITQAW